MPSKHDVVAWESGIPKYMYNNKTDQTSTSNFRLTFFLEDEGCYILRPINQITVAVLPQKDKFFSTLITSGKLVFSDHIKQGKQQI